MWGQWHEGTCVDVRLHLPLPETYPNDFKCKVQLRDRKTQRVIQRRGIGKHIGNFAPIYIQLNGERKMLEMLLREKEVKFPER